MTPCTYANRYRVAIQTDGIALLEFGRATPAGEEMHSGVALTIADAEGLSQMLAALIQQARQNAAGTPENVTPLRGS